MSTPLPPIPPGRRPAARPRGARLLALLLLPGLAGCSGTRFGDALSRSFSSGSSGGSTNGPATSAGAATGGATAATPAPAAGEASSGAGPAAGRSVGASPANAGAPGAKPGKAPSSATTAAAASPPAGGAKPPINPAGSTATSAASTPASATTPPRPAPYRVTILLPQADAAAPAEVVTQALRAAGVPFEVETIERLGRNTTPSASQAPVSRPVPEPR